MTASANSTSHPRSDSMDIISGDDMDDVQEITIEQSCKFNARNLILPQKQEHSTGCTATCAAMCVCQTQKQFLKDGIPINSAEWGIIANKYGYTYQKISDPSLQKVYDLLKEGYPVIVEVNHDPEHLKSHWVTVYQYTGTKMNVNKSDASDFMCLDPWTGESCKLDNSLHFDESSPVNRMCYFKQKVC